MFLITEAPLTISTPKKVKTIKDKIRFEAVLQTCGDINRNRRRYSKSVLQEGVNSVMPRIKERTFIGELDHPTDANAARQITVLFKEASHLFVEMGWDGNKLIGVLETLRSPNGEILKNFIEDKIPVGFSFRGMGDIRELRESQEIVYEIKGPLHVVTWDSVAYPSHAKATFTKITENTSKKLVESAKVLVESCSIEHKNGMICTKEGICYLPNDFDKLVEQKVINLENKFIL